MTRVLLWICVVMTLSGLARAQELGALTVPASDLPAGCTMPHASSIADGGIVIGGLWAGLPITANPWIGSDAVVIAAIRERLEPPAAAPDGPPLSAVDRARFRLRLAEGVEAAYAAFYVDRAGRRTAVYGIKHLNAAKVEIRVSASESECREAVAAHIAKLPVQ